MNIITYFKYTLDGIFYRHFIRKLSVFAFIFLHHHSTLSPLPPSPSIPPPTPEAKKLEMGENI